MLRPPPLALVAAVVLCASPAASAQGPEREVLVLRRPDADSVRRDWPRILAHLRAGGPLLQLGGPPLSDAPEFARRLLIGPAERVPFPTGGSTVAASGYDGPPPPAADAYACVVRFTTLKDFPEEDGTAGPRDAVLRPLAHVVDAEGFPRAAPIIEIDRLRGPFAGGRWIFVATDGEVSPELEAALRARAAQGATDLAAVPRRASLAAGEAAEFTVERRRPHAAAAPFAVDRFAPEESPATYVAVAPDGRGMQGSFVLRGRGDARTGTFSLPGAFAAAAGFYRVTVRCEDEAQPGAVETGFRVRAAEPPAIAPLGVSRDWLTRDGRPVPIVGTTYMASDVHRKFLFEPNPAVFERDFAAMRAAGLNFVRTGLWTGWNRAMVDPGALDEGVLAALEAFVDAAAAHEIDVCFTFFAFQPPRFGGVNPFLDPRAREGQRAWIRAVAGRLRGRGRVHYDLINEPSYSPADQLWTNRPIGDAFEAAAWRAFLERRFGMAELLPEQKAVVLREALGDAGDDPYAPPTTADQQYAMVRENRSPRRAVAFGAFTNAVVAEWAADLRREIRVAAGKNVLVTLGQDEGGTENRPAQLLHADAVDYTALHNWWKNDDLLFDGLATKAEGVPNLVSETGLMRLEDVDGRPWRDPLAAARLLERKCALAFGARGAGVVQWAWNINPYMPIDNEATIGLWRPDGTAKPEFDVLRRFAAFARRAAPALDDYEPAEVVLVLPQARVWAGRPRGLDGAKRLVRVLADRFGVAPRCAPGSAADMSAPGRPPYGASVKLSLHPWSEFDDADPTALDEATGGAPGRGAEPKRRRLAFGPLRGEPSTPVALREPTPWGGRDGAPAWVTFDQNAGEWLRKSASRGAPPDPATGLWHEPLPLDLAREEEPLREVLAAALRAAGAATSPATQPLTATVWRTPHGALITVVNETAADGTRRITVDGRDFDVVVAAGRARCVFVDRRTGAIVADSDAAP
jgi:hypothetical protein